MIRLRQLKLTNSREFVKYHSKTIATDLKKHQILNMKGQTNAHTHCVQANQGIGLKRITPGETLWY